MPVMEGKALLFKAFAGIDAFPICLNVTDTEQFIAAVKMMEPTFGGINLEDISAPQCFEIEARLKQEMGIPVFHDDQHGTAVVTIAALINAVKLTNRTFSGLKVVVNGAGAAGIAVVKLLREMGVSQLTLCDTKGIIYAGRSEGMNVIKEEVAQFTNPQRLQGTLKDAMKGADVFIGVSTAGAVTEEMVRSMNSDPIIFAMANPDPEILPESAIRAGARVVGTGRSDYPNQVNNVLAFPGIFRGALDVRAKEINEEMKVAAARAIASLVTEEQLRDNIVIPNPFDSRVVASVAEAVAQAAIETGVAKRAART
jgi:malate dehydrogenase (oxaloacetate-decarboxylating)